MPSRYQHVQIPFPPALMDRLNALSKTTGIPKSRLVRKAVELQLPTWELRAEGGRIIFTDDPAPSPAAPATAPTGGPDDA